MLFWAMAALAIVTCILVGILGVEPRSYLPKKDETLLPGLAFMTCQTATQASYKEQRRSMLWQDFIACKSV